ncbi:MULTISPECIES: c-type cytochrome biogenesis protein CcsB [Rhodococcus]|uniref:Cytochrome c assembly membrane protein n=1 Tax=Rhodococcus pyridinivorans AK37 TaxID=1114960 RepID=H0JRS4_9NOCA|nr:MULTISPECIES: c-type cytochrome biogenesis protein CcsB [Rhodococcus]EHK83486.1 cytochrome c assembly membrane protein [Rhodococcus pyridinivorans AK37]KHJ72232.1 cytochrome C assembly protein [Rhodococcus sp. Chr-9]MBX4169190.1 c-type cytochrome biogenesis protein CcsB [Rhodococcus sp. DMU2021]MCD2116389.1 c-type cytochrome biogenesis protein CcsB [Rhodococcus pyridinivorans]MCD2142472.1 c-type cytochrome biogenesis protein CcsB [Rhodococcus pyridinivorans]
MTENDTLAQYSDWAFESAFAVLVLALLLLIAEYATHRADVVAERERELVAAGRQQAPAERATGPGRIDQTPKRTVSQRLGNMGRALVVVVAGLQLASIVLRGLATERFPLGNMYEFVSMACTAAVIFGLIVLRKPAYRIMWVYLVVPVLILMFLAATVLYADAAPVVPALRSFWLPIHVTIISVGSGIFLVSGVASVLFLLRIRFPKGEERSGVFAAIAERLPDAQTLDRLAYRTTIIGFPLFGAGIILGAIWAEAAWGRFWGWDPKETVSFISWVIYAAYLHARATSGWRNTRAAWINIVGFVTVLFNLFIINMVVSGLHSYAGLN